MSFRNLIILSLSAALATASAQQAGPAPKMQLPADQRAYTAARAQLDPAARLAALRQFLAEYPKSSRASRARSVILDILLAYFPDKTTEIDAQAKAIVKNSGKGNSRINAQDSVAQKLAEAGTNGIDLPLAEKFANEANKALQEPGFNKEILADYAESKLPPPPAAELHEHFIQQKSEALSVVAEVAFHEGKLDQARDAADQAFAVDPTVDDTNSIRGEIALADHHDAAALDDFERAQLYGALRPVLHTRMLALYRAAHNGSDATFETDQDARYLHLFPAPFTFAAHSPVQGGHTALVELFTGSGCQPCAGADLAMEAMLEAYPRSEVVTLSWDQHIPLPDPLANPDSLARAKEYGVQYTPTFAIDGQTLPAAGSLRSGSEALYKKVTKSLDADIARPSAAHIELAAHLTEQGQVTAQAHVTLGSETTLQNEIATLPVPPSPAAPDPKTATKPAAAPTAAAPPIAPNLVLNVALVEDNIRYSGENGIRFHRMVVRALAKPSGEGFELVPGSSAIEDVTFQPTEIAQRLGDYLNAYEKHNDRFENTHFLSKNTSLNPAGLKVVAWIENTANHRILQSAIVSLTSAPNTGEAE